MSCQNQINSDNIINMSVRRIMSIRSCCLSLILVAAISLQIDCTVAFSNSPRSFVTTHHHHHRTSECKIRPSNNMYMSSEDDSNYNEYKQQQSNNNNQQKVTGRKRAIVRKYGKAIAISTTLLYGPMACLPSTRRITSTTAHATDGCVDSGYVTVL